MSGITKREPPISWRPSKQAREKLARLVSETGLSRNDLLNQLIIEHGVSTKSESPPTGEPIPDIHRKPKKVTPYRPTGGINRERVLAFQNLTGMDKAPKRS